MVDLIVLLVAYGFVTFIMGALVIAIALALIGKSINKEIGLSEFLTGICFMVFLFLVGSGAGEQFARVWSLLI